MASTKLDINTTDVAPERAKMIQNPELKKTKEHLINALLKPPLKVIEEIYQNLDKEIKNLLNEKTLKQQIIPELIKKWITNPEDINKILLSIEITKRAIKEKVETILRMREFIENRHQPIHKKAA